VESQNVAQGSVTETGSAANMQPANAQPGISQPANFLAANSQSPVPQPDTNLRPDTSKLPTIERKTDHLNTIVTTLCVVTFLPLPLLLAFGLKSFLWMGIVICVVAVIRLINSPVQLQKPAPPVSDSVSAAMRQRHAVRESGINTTSCGPSSGQLSNQSSSQPR
jgi:hypothetical protein